MKKEKKPTAQFARKAKAEICYDSGKKFGGTEGEACCSFHKHISMDRNGRISQCEK